MSNENVVFRRIRGRIIPIKLSKAKKEQLTGVGIAGVGAGVAIAGGRAFSKLSNMAIDTALKGLAFREAVPRQFSNGKKLFKATSQLTFDDMAVRNSIINADKAKAAASRLAKSAKFVRKASPYLGSALIGLGAAKFLNGLSKEKKSKMSPDLLNVLGVAATTTATYASINSEKLFTISAVSGKQEAFKFMGQSVTSKLKTAAQAILKKKLIP